MYKFIDVMSKYLFLVLLISYASTVKSQNIGLNYYSTGAGRNITVSYSEIINNSEIGIGLGYNIGSIKQPDDQNNIYYKRLFPTKSLHHLNFNLTYEHDIFYNLKTIKPIVFYDLQIKYSTTRSSMYTPYDYDSTYLNTAHPEDGVLYKKHVAYFGPYTWIENSVGIGFKVDITNKFYLKQKIGGGVYFIHGYDSGEDIVVKPKTEWEFMGLLNVGIVYRLKEKPHNSGS